MHISNLYMDKILKSTNTGELDLNGIKVSCAVLEDGTRVLVNRSLYKRWVSTQLLFKHSNK